MSAATPGLAAGHTTWQDTVPLGTIDATMSGQTANTDMSGAIFGGQIGCSYQFSPLVIGLEGSVSASNLTGTNMISSTLPGRFGSRASPAALALRSIGCWSAGWG